MCVISRKIDMQWRKTAHMAKSKLIIEYDYNFSLFGLITVAKDYRLAWLINRTLDLHLVKEQDIEIDFVNKEKLVISNYLYETEHSQLRLLKNRSEERTSDIQNYLIPELNRFDYFIIKSCEIQDVEDNELINRLLNIREIQFATTLDIDKLKSKDNLLF